MSTEKTILTDRVGTKRKYRIRRFEANDLDMDKDYFEYSRGWNMDNNPYYVNNFVGYFKVTPID